MSRDPLHRPTPIIFYAGKPRSALNKALLDQQDAWDNIEALVEAHELRCHFIEMMEESAEPALWRSLAADIFEVDMYLQEKWKFELDPDYVRFWELPHCTCPVLDNRDAYPDRQIISLSCPIHGEENE